MGVGYYHAFRRLSENRIQLNGRKNIRPDKVVEDISCADGRKLVGISDHNKTAVERKRPQKRIEKKGIHHRHFVNDEGIAF